MPRMAATLWSKPTSICTTQLIVAATLVPQPSANPWNIARRLLGFWATESWAGYRPALQVAAPPFRHRRQALASDGGPPSSARRDSKKVAMLQPVNAKATAGSDQAPRASHAWLPTAEPSDMPT